MTHPTTPNQGGATAPPTPRTNHPTTRPDRSHHDRAPGAWMPRTLSSRDAWRRHGKRLPTLDDYDQGRAS